MNLGFRRKNEKKADGVRLPALIKVKHEQKEQGCSDGSAGNRLCRSSVETWVWILSTLFKSQVWWGRFATHGRQGFLRCWPAILAKEVSSRSRQNPVSKIW